jgi:prepilin-type N-terminal cleavage/methylation domain-containing protein
MNRPRTFSYRSGRCRRNDSGFTLFEMMITLAIFLMLAAAVFGIMAGVIQSTSTLQDNQNRRDQVEALTAYLKKQLVELPTSSTLVSYQRGTGEGLLQNGIIFGTVNLASALDGKIQSNGYYSLRVATFSTGASLDQGQDARQVLLQLVTADDPTLVWTPLITDLKTLDWKFQDVNVVQWVDLWTSTTKPNLVEFSMQIAGDLQPTTVDLWLPKIDTVSFAAARGRGGNQTPAPPQPPRLSPAPPHAP